MRCEDAQAAVSARLDGESVDGAAVDEHVGSCVRCQAFVAGCADIRRRLRVSPVRRVPDLAASIDPAVPAPHAASGSRWRGFVQVAASFVVAALVAGTLVWGTSGRGVARADVADSVFDAQRAVTTLDASVTIVERGWHPDVPERRFEGELFYEAPESLAIRLRDRTTYPDVSWPRNDVDVVVRDDTSWSRGVRECPTAALPACIPAAPRLEVVTGREPFADVAPLPLDLVVPVTTFRNAADVAVERTRVGGRDAMAVTVTAAQAASLLQGLGAVGNLRSFHPADRVDLWLDAEVAVPLHLTVTALDDPDRASWAAAQGYADRPGLTLLDVSFGEVRVNEPVPATRFPPPPRDPSAAEAPVDAAFVDDADVRWVPVPSALPPRMRPHRSGRVDIDAHTRIGARSWSDGREWVKVAAATEWTEPRLFGALDEGARRVELADGGVAYLDSAASRVALHGDAVEVVVSGSAPLEDLLAIAASLPGRGLPVPGGWAEATSVDRRTAGAALPGLLLPDGLEGFAPPGFRVDDGVVTAVYGGAGERAFTLTQGPGAKLPPPLDVDARGVVVRGTTGRWNPARGELEWREEGRLVSLRSRTLSLDELLVIARSLEGA